MRRSCLCLVAAVMMLYGTSHAAPVTAQWLGGVGNYGDSSKWDIGVVPRNNFPVGTTYDVRIGGVGTNVIYDGNLHAHVDALAIGDGATLTIGNNQDLTVDISGTLSNAGEIVM